MVRDVTSRQLLLYLIIAGLPSGLLPSFYWVYGDETYIHNLLVPFYFAPVAKLKYKFIEQPLSQYMRIIRNCNLTAWIYQAY